METIFGCFIFTQYEFQGMIGYLDFSQPGRLWREQTVTSLLFFCGNKPFRDDKYLACRYSTLNEIQGNGAVTSCEECEGSLKAHKKGKQESEWVCFTVPHKLSLKYKAAAPSCEQREKPCCKVCGQQRSWMRICTIFYTDSSLALLQKEKPACDICVGRPQLSTQQTGSLVRRLGQREWMGHAAAQTNNWSPQDRAVACCHRGVAGEAVLWDIQ